MNISERINSEYLAIKEKYPGLHLQKKTDKLWEVFGNLHFSGMCDVVKVEDQYSLSIFISHGYPGELPAVQSIDGRIPEDFHTNGKHLCLGAPLGVRMNFHKDPTLLGFISNCLVPYLTNYSYYERNGQLLIGELSHGPKGIFEHIRDLFCSNNIEVIINLLEFCLSEPFRELFYCPCKSGKRVKKCHGSVLKAIKESCSENEILNTIQQLRKYHQTEMINQYTIDK